MSGLLDHLAENVSSLPGAAAIAVYSLASYELTDENGPLRQALVAVQTHTTTALAELDKLDNPNRPPATITRLHPSNPKEPTT